MNELTKNENLLEVVNAGEVANPFGGSLSQVGSVGTAQAVSHELAEMQAQIYLAKQFPRDQRRAMDNILTACQRPGLAQVAVYAYSKGGTDISGPSIRLAEEIARDWGNLECGWNELERDYDSSKIRAFAWDKETNVLKTLFFFVPHYRTTKTKGRTRITDERELYELLANQAARRMRNCILALIPGDVVDAAVDQCKRTLVTHCNITPESIQKLVAAFSAFGVSKAQLEKKFQRRIDAIAPAQFVSMRTIYNSLRDGMSSPAEWFDPEEETAEKGATSTNSATESLKTALGGQKRASRASKKQKFVNDPVVEEPQTSEDPETNNNVPYVPDGLESQLRQEIAKSTTREELEILAAQIGDLDLPQEVKDGLLQFVDQKAMSME